MTLVELKKVVKIYGSLGGPTYAKALDGISLRIAEGEFTSIMGPSGSGKSTLLYMIGCLDKPTSGKVLIDGKNTVRMSIKELNSLRLRKIGFIFQTFNLIPTLTALENIEFRLSLAGLSSTEQRERATEYIRLVGLERRLKHRPSQLSAGECQRVAIARAIANDPDLVLADEPTGNLDTAIGDEIVHLMKDLNRELGKTFLIVTHNPRVAKATDRVVHLRDGKIVEDRSKGSLLLGKVCERPRFGSNHRSETCGILSDWMM